jgi:hypothetical protein
LLRNGEDCYDKILFGKGKEREGKLGVVRQAIGLCWALEKEM